MKKVILVSAVMAVVALAACRREEAVPMKLGADMPVAQQR